MDRFKTILSQLSPDSAAHTIQAEPTVLYDSNGTTMKITFNRPKHLNSLNYAMIDSMFNKAADIQKHKIAIFKAAGEKSFCAGGDIRGLYDLYTSQIPEKFELIQSFFEQEFILDHFVAHMNPVQIAIWHGIVMGGGVGISCHAKYRIACETTVFAMPELQLNFYTDVGASYFLPTLKDSMGLYLALTADRLVGEEVYLAGAANYYVKKENLPKLEAELFANQDPDQIDAIIRKYQEQPKKTTTPKMQLAKALFNTAGDVQSLIKALQTVDDSKFGAPGIAKLVLKGIISKSPFSVVLNYELIKYSKERKLTPASALTLDYRIISRFSPTSPPV